LVVIITLNYNQNDYTVKCIESILKSNYDNFKLLLIDNGSNLENYENLKSSLPNNPILELCRIDDNRGYVGGINFGLEKANAYNPEYCLIMNNDTILDENAISELVTTSKNFDDKAIVSGKVYHYDEPNVLQDIGLIFSNRKALKFSRIGIDEEDIGQFDEVSERDLLDDVFWLFPINLYHKIGGYSPYFWFNAEQADFGLRAKEEGYKLIFTPKAKLWHKGSISIGGRGRNPKLAYWHVQSTLIFRYLHLSKIEFSIQYFKMGISIISSYFKVIVEKFKGVKIDFGYPNAKLKGFQYFNKWFFLRNENKGDNPFN
jgi:GT2 family glycosyltransferase